ncbi:CHAT domain-containing protein [Herbidospora mongoliensis]|uniref:CHAT domain-containing protein n=1 Tax=Herbidospora mongoliensis TaxID=688067 RepID=UPI00082BE33B|nr:CHAT domain-containing protein [Herbidospora mongoliensis]
MAEALANYDEAASRFRNLRKIMIMPSQRRFLDILAGQSLLSGAMLLTETGADPVGAEQRYRQAEISLARSGSDRPEFHACLTSFGHFLRTQGRFIEAEAIFSAGARWVVASLWPVPDAAAKRLMVDFYEHLRAGADVPSALHAAKAVAREKSKTARVPDRPFWAAFVALGADRKSLHADMPQDPRA